MIRTVFDWLVFAVQGSDRARRGRRIHWEVDRSNSVAVGVGGCHGRGQEIDEAAVGLVAGRLSLPSSPARMASLVGSWTCSNGC